jgi:hypothetical protein
MASVMGWITLFILIAKEYFYNLVCIGHYFHEMIARLDTAGAEGHGQGQNDETTVECQPTSFDLVFTVK